MRRVWLVVPLLLLVVAWFLIARDRGHGGTLGATSTRPTVPVPKEAAPPPSAPPAARPDPRRAARAQRDALRDQLVAALTARPASAPPQDPVPPRVYPPGTLRDRIGGRDALARSLNHDFMPLASECIDRAQERDPTLRGTLALSVETLADEQLGAVVDRAEPAPENQVAEAELLECLRESAYSLRLPPPPGSGREKFLLTLPIEPPDGGVSAAGPAARR